MPTLAKSGASTAGFRSVSSIGGAPRIGSSGIKSLGSAPSLASKINSFQRVSFNSKESSRGSVGLSAKDMSFGSSSLKLFNNPSSRSESRPSVKFLGNINTKPISTFGENKSSRPNPIKSEPQFARAFGRKEVPGTRTENLIISFQPGQAARGAERFGINNSNRAKGLERFQNLPYIDLVDRAKGPNRIKEVKPVMEVPGISRREAFPKKTTKAENPSPIKPEISTKTTEVPSAKTDQLTTQVEKRTIPAVQADKKDQVNPNSDRITAQQTRSLLSLEPLVTLGILTQAEAKKRAGIIEDEEKEHDKKKKAKTLSQAQANSQNNQEKNSITTAPAIQPEQAAAKAQELTQLLQVMQISVGQDRAAAIAQTGQSTGIQAVAERAQKLASQLEEKTGTGSAASSDIVETIGQRIQSRLKKVVKVVTRTKKEREETEEKDDQKIKVRFFQEDHEAKKARIDDAVKIYEQIRIEQERAGVVDGVVGGKVLANRYELTKDKRGRVLRQQGTDLEDGTSVDMRELLSQIEEITPEKIVAANEIKELMAVELVDEIETEASKKEAVRRTFEQNKSIGQIAITGADEQVVSFETVEMTTSQAGEITQTIKKVEEPEIVDEQLVEEGQVIPELTRQLEIVQKTLRLERFTIPQRLALVPIV